MRRGLIGPTLILLLLLATGALVMLGEMDESVNLSSVIELWADALRDVDQVGMQLTRVSDEEETQFGIELADNMEGMTENPEWTVYVSDVGSELLPYIDRKGISYSFHAVEAEHIQAFALPGGQIYITTGMLGFLQSEAELASVLGHEISHVDLRHCVERFQSRLAMRKVGMEEMAIVAEIAHSLILAGYDQSQELEADAHGLRMSVQAGYDAEAAATVFLRLMEEMGEPAAARAKDPAGELAGAVEGAIGSYCSSHPTSEERHLRLKAFMSRNRRRMADKPGYIGAKSYEGFKKGGRCSAPPNRAARKAAGSQYVDPP